MRSNKASDANHSKVSKKKYVRIRPYIDSHGLRNLRSLHSCRSTNSADEFFFNSGRAALKWLFVFLRKERKVPLKIGI